jgi:outer membrane protein assembly complex protein YaeT
MRPGGSIAVYFLGLLVVVPTFATPQEGEPGGTVRIRTSDALPPDAVIDEIKFVGLHRIPAETAKAQLSFHSGEKFDSARVAADVGALNRIGWFEDVLVKAEESNNDSRTSTDFLPHFKLKFHVEEYPLLAGVEYSGSKILSQHQVEKLLKDKKLLPETGAPANPVKLHRVTLMIQEELRTMGHPEARVLIAQEKLPGQKVKVEFQVHDGPHLPVVAMHFSGDPQISESILRKQMREIAPDAWFSGLRNKNVFTRRKIEQDRVNLHTYLQNHGFPQARVGTPQVTHVEAFFGRSLHWLRRRSEPGLSVGLPIEAGNLYHFGPIEVSTTLKEKLGSGKKQEPLLSHVAPGQPFSQHAVESLQRAWEIRLRRNAQRRKGDGNYRLQAVQTFDGPTHLASVKFDFDPMPSYVVRRIDFRGNGRFPDRFLRRRIGLREGQPFDEYELESGLARIARTGYFQRFEKTDVRIEMHDPGHTADVTIQIREKGKQRATFSGGREQFGSTLGIAYAVFNLLGMDEFLSTQIDVGPESLQLAIGFAKEGFLGSRGTLALSVFDTLLRPGLIGGVQAPFQRTRSQGANAGWSYPASSVDAVGMNFGVSRSLTEFAINRPASSTGSQATDLRSETSSHSLGIGWTHYDGEERIQLADSVSGGLLGGNENLLRSQAEYGRIFPDEIFNNHNAWAFRTTVRAAGSYKGNMPLYARFFSGDDLVRGLQPGELGPYQTVATVSPSGATTYSAAPSGADLVAASNLEYRFPLGRGVEGATFFDAGSGMLLPNWLGQSRSPVINSTNGLIYGATGFEVRWTLPAVGVPLRVNYSFNILRLNRAVIMPDGSVFHLHNRVGALGWGLGQLF